MCKGRFGTSDGPCCASGWAINWFGPDYDTFNGDFAVAYRRANGLKANQLVCAYNDSLPTNQDRADAFNVMVAEGLVDLEGGDA